MTIPFRFSAVAALALGLTCQAVSAQADTFDWNNLTYAPSTAHPAGTAVPDGNSTSGNNSLSTQLVLSTGASYYTGVASPAVNSYSANNVYASGGNADTTQKSLQIAVDFANNTQFVTVTLFFTQPVTSASFSFFDVDSGNVNNGGYIDQVRAIQAGTSANPGALAPTLTAGTDNSVSGNAVTARANNPIDTTYTNAQNAAGGNVAVTFNGTSTVPSFSQISFVYGDTVPTGTTHSAVQIIALSNITFAPVPEPGTTATLAAGIFGAGIVAFRRRRRA